MSSDTKIEWTDATWSPIRGCSRVSAGCQNCYAERLTARFSRVGMWGHSFAKMSDAGARWTGKVELVESQLEIPLRWHRPRRIFVNSLSDTFHPGVTGEMLDKVFAVMAMCPQHTFQVLTKRPEQAALYLTELRNGKRLIASAASEIRRGFISTLLVAQAFGKTLEDKRPPYSIPKNIWLGVSVENQETADERIPRLLGIGGDGLTRWVSYEPALGPVDFEPWLLTEFDDEKNLDWIVIGGESGPKARPFDIAWARDTIDAGRRWDVPIFMKQVGSKPTTDIRTRPAGEDWTWTAVLRDRKGGDMQEWPRGLRIREFPR